MKISFLSVRLSRRAILDKVIELSYLAVVFLVPIWFAVLFPTFNLFELNKIIIFRALVWILFGLTALKLLFFLPENFISLNKKNLYQIGKKYFLIPVLLIVGLFITLFFSIDYQQSFFGSYDRQQGFSSYLFYFIWAVLLFVDLSLTDKNGTSNTVNLKIHRILLTASFTSTLVAIYGILQILNIDFLTWPEPPHLTGRTISSFGQPNFLASFLLLVIPLNVYLALWARKFFVKFWFALAVFLQLICLFFTSSRGGLVALVLWMLIFAAYLFFASNIGKGAKLKVVFSILALGVIGFFSLEMLTPGRMRESFNIGAGSFAARVNFFQASADAIVKKPVFGYGLENSGEIFIKYYERDWGIYGDVSSNTDRAHNILLDIMLSTGFFGLVLFAFWYYSFFKLSFLNTKFQANKNLTLALASGAGAYLISLLFSFAIVATEVYFWLFFAIIATTHYSQIKSIQEVEALKKASIRAWKIILDSLIWVVIIWQLVLNARSLIADAYLNDIYNVLARGEKLEAVVFHDYIAALHVNPSQMKFYNHFTGDNLSSQYLQSADLATKTVVKLKLEEIYKNLPESGYKNILLKATIASHLENYTTADIYFAEIFSLAPNWPLGYLERAQDFMRRGDLENAEKAFQLMDINLPDLNSDKLNDRHRQTAASYKYVAYISLGDAYFAKGRYEIAEKFFQAAYRNRPEDYSILKKIADSYYLRGDIDTALKYVLRGASFNPDDYNWQVALASLNFEAGNKEKALFYIDEAIRLAPDQENLEKIEIEYQK